MLHYFKKYLGHVGPTTVASTSFGAICGGVIGFVGLYKISSLDGYVSSMDPYKNITPEEILSHQRYAVGIGASIGSLAGLSVGAIIYPAYTRFFNLCRCYVCTVVGLFYRLTVFVCNLCCYFFNASCNHVFQLLFYFVFVTSIL